MSRYHYYHVLYRETLKKSNFFLSFSYFLYWFVNRLYFFVPLFSLFGNLRLSTHLLFFWESSTTTAVLRFDYCNRSIIGYLCFHAVFPVLLESVRSFSCLHVSSFVFCDRFCLYYRFIAFCSIVLFLRLSSILFATPLLLFEHFSFIWPPLPTCPAFFVSPFLSRDKWSPETERKLKDRTELRPRFKKKEKKNETTLAFFSFVGWFESFFLCYRTFGEFFVSFSNGSAFMATILNGR